MPFPNGIKVAGNPQPIPFQTEIEVSTVNGQETVVTYRGETSQMYAAFPNLAVGSQTARYRQDGPTATVEVRYKKLPGGGVEVSKDTIDLSFNEISASIYRNPHFQTLSASEIADITASLDEIKSLSGADQEQDRLDEIVALGATTNGALKVEALYCLLEGTETYTYLAPVLVYTKNVSIDYPTKLELNDVGTIFSTATLPIPNGLFNLFDVPDVSSSIAVRPGYALAWLKTARMNVVSDGGVQLITQFTYDAYKLILYTGTHD